MKSLLTALFLLTLIPLSLSIRPYRPTPSNPNSPNAYILPIFHRYHPKVQTFLSALEPPLEPLSVAPLHSESNKLVYYAEFILGKTQTMGVLDTGSFFTWLKVTASSDPTLSDTYRPLPCNTNLCGRVPSNTCPVDKTQCLYNVQYVDGSTSAGDVGIDRLSVFSAYGTGYLPNSRISAQMVFGSATDGTNTLAGVLGVSSHSLGLLTGLNVRHFSVCFPNITGLQSHIRFGNDSRLYGLPTPMFNNNYRPAFRVMSIWVNKFQVTNLTYSPNDGADFIFDTGAALTNLHPVAYDNVVQRVKDVVAGSPSSISELGYGLCFGPRDKKALRSLEFAFELDGGGALDMSFSNLWVPVTDVWCLGIRRAKSYRSILGVKQMQGWNFGLDYEESNFYVHANGHCV